MTTKQPRNGDGVFEVHGGGTSPQGVRRVVGAATFKTWGAELPEEAIGEAALRLRHAGNWIKALSHQPPDDDAPTVRLEVAELMLALWMWAWSYPRPIARLNDQIRGYWLLRAYGAAGYSRPTCMDTLAGRRSIERARAALNALSQVESDEVRGRVQDALWEEAEQLRRAVRAFATRQKVRVPVGIWPGQLRSLRLESGSRAEGPVAPAGPGRAAPSSLAAAPSVTECPAARPVL